jgi:hypothetical protein
MKKTICLKTTLVLCLCFTFHGGTAKTKTLSLRKAIAAKLVRIKANALGGISCKALKLDVSSDSKDTLYLQIEPGLFFKPDDDSRQPLVTQGDEVLVLNSCEQKSMELNAFCGNSSASCPERNDGYTFTRQLDTVLVSILRYAKRNNFPLWLSQHSVWMVTNNHSLRSVYMPEYQRESELLIKYIAEKRKLELPTFYIHHSIDSSGRGPVVRKGHERIFVKMNWSADKGYRNVYVTVYKPDGSIYKTVQNDIVSDKYGSAVVVPFTPLRDKPGKYIVRVHDDAKNILQEKTVELDGISEHY